MEEPGERRVKEVARRLRPNTLMNNAVAVGIVGVEIVKLLLNKPVDSFRNASIHSPLPQPWFFLNL